MKIDDSAEDLNVARGRSENEDKGKGKKYGSKSKPKGDSGGKFNCYYCHEPSHFKKNCPKRRSGGNSSAQIAVDEEEG
ncbi:acylamino-acid-releasing enzyme [Trifolium medium]|uniref:Acylamino-acid-releasing enzyme n=1 Tax=Trifolium medium TaxID=97028 RepID=A0A392RZD6_9FABA|nr:acylamino-acid-releasing enzyme [Trifolium medium]